MRLKHLYFANDNLLFCKAKTLEWLRIQQVLEIYENAFGQKLNRENLYFLGKNTRRVTKEHITLVAWIFF
jgi:hypothetical protein